LIEKEIQKRTAQNDKLLEAVGRAGGSNPEFNMVLNEFKKFQTAFRQTRDQEVIALVKQGKNDEAKKLALGIQDERYEKRRALAFKMADMSKARAAQQIKDSDEVAARAIPVFLLFGGVAVVISGAMVMYLTRIIARPLKEISQVAEKISSGDLVVAVSMADRKDEVGVLGRAVS